MPSKKLEQAINQQIQRELYSSYLYLAMSAYCEQINLDGFAHWMRLQSEEERGHSMRCTSSAKVRHFESSAKRQCEPMLIGLV